MHILIFFSTAQYGPGCFEYRGTAGTYTYNGFVGTWPGNEEKLTLYASQQVRATKIVVTYESAASLHLENIDTTVAPAKVIKNGQLIITKDGVEYNAQGAVAK